MRKLLHEFDFQQRLVDLKGIDMYLLEGEPFSGLVLSQVDAAEAALADELDHFIGLHRL
jgi:hypothetical protein